MAIETLEDTIEQTDQGRVNQEDGTVSTTCSSCTTSCPESVDVTVENNAITIDGGTMVTETVVPAGDHVTITLTYTPISDASVSLYINGVLQSDYSISAKVITLPTLADATDVIVAKYFYDPG